MSLFELAFLIAVVVWIVKAAEEGKHFERAWIGLFLGAALMLSRRLFLDGVILACVSVAALTLPLARAEWERAQQRKS